MARWLIATLAFLGIGWLDFRFGHTVALGTLLVALVLIAIFGGHGRRPGHGGPPAPDAGQAAAEQPETGSPPEDRGAEGPARSGGPPGAPPF